MTFSIVLAWWVIDEERCTVDVEVAIPEAGVASGSCSESRLGTTRDLRGPDRTREAATQRGSDSPGEANPRGHRVHERLEAEVDTIVQIPSTPDTRVTRAAAGQREDNEGLGRSHDRPFDPLRDRRLADHDQRGLPCVERLRGLMELLARQSAGSEPLRDHPVVRMIHTLDDVRLTVLLVDDRGVELADQLILVAAARTLGDRPLRPRDRC